MQVAFETGLISENLVHDLLRMECLADWGGCGYKFVPKIIEDQYRVYKHDRQNKVALKKRPGIKYIKGVKF